MKNSILKAFLFVASLSAIPLKAQTVPISGDLTVSGSFRAGNASSEINADFNSTDGILFLKGAAGVGTTSNIPDPYVPYMRWYPGKGAFRAGQTMLYEDYLGYYSTAFGYQTLAAGNYSLASGNYSFAWGEYSTALGSSTAAGFASFSSGYDAEATGESSVAIGMNLRATGYSAVALGQHGQASGQNSFTVGNNQAEGGASTAFGTYTWARSYASVAIGSLNLANGSPYEWIETDPLFEIGNGREATRSNAMTVYKNGNVAVQGVITCAPGGDIPMFTGN